MGLPRAPCECAIASLVCGRWLSQGTSSLTLLAPLKAESLWQLMPEAGEGASYSLRSARRGLVLRVAQDGSLSASETPAPEKSSVFHAQEVEKGVYALRSAASSLWLAVDSAGSITCSASTPHYQTRLAFSLAPLLCQLHPQRLLLAPGDTRVGLCLAAGRGSWITVGIPPWAPLLPGGELTGRTPALQPWELVRLRVVERTAHTFALLGDHGRFVREVKPGVVCADATSVGAAETMKMVPQADGSFALRMHSGGYVSAQRPRVDSRAAVVSEAECFFAVDESEGRATYWNSNPAAVAASMAAQDAAATRQDAVREESVGAPHVASAHLADL